LTLEKSLRGREGRIARGGKNREGGERGRNGKGKQESERGGVKRCKRAAQFLGRV